MSDAPEKPKPLDELFPALKRPTEEIPKLPVHPRVLEVRDGDGTALVVVVWRDPGTSLALHQAIRQRFEGALLAELSRPASELRAEERNLTALRLVVCTETKSDVARAVQAFGLVRADAESPSWRETLAYVRGEAARVDEPSPDAPASVWEVPIRIADGERGEKVRRLEAELRETTGDEVWGTRPGAFFGRATSIADKLFREHVGADEAGLLAFEELVGQRTEGHVRLVPPMLFQALCDAVGVIAVRVFGTQVEWAPSEPDELGFAAPPLFRAKIDGAFVHVPIGLHLLRWCSMPLGRGESVPTVAAWVRDQFGSSK